jgi:hypothetical protein
MPSQDWVLRHIGLEVSTPSRPPGAPEQVLPGWVWWLPQEPAWTSWIARGDEYRRVIRGVRLVFFALVGVALTAPISGWAIGVIAITAAVSAGLGLLSLHMSLRHFTKDPFGEIRKHHHQVAAQLGRGVTIKDRPSLDLIDLLL